MSNDGRFYLELRKNGEPALIFYRKYVNGEPVKISLGYKIIPELWDLENQIPTTNKKLINEYLKQDPRLKTHLSNIQTRINNFKEESAAFIQTQILNRTEINLKEFKDHLKNTVKASDRNKKTVSEKLKPTDYSFIGVYANKFLKDITSGDRMFVKKELNKKVKVRYELGTIKSYKNCLITWKHFEEFKRTKFKWSDFNQSLYDSLVSFLESKGYGTNYIGKVIKCLKVIFRAAFEDEITDCQEFNKKYFVILSVDSHSIALTTEEVRSIEEIDLSTNETFDKARDMFLLGCYTALRISDLMKINKDHIKGKFLDMIITKTKNPIKIPLKENALNILKKYNYNSPKIAEQTVNKSIKQIAKMCGIDEKISFIENVNNTERERKCPKYELITNHTGRRTAATLMNKSKIDRLMIMRITGHKTESSFLKYIKITKDEAAETMAENSFFI